MSDTPEPLETNTVFRIDSKIAQNLANKDIYKNKTRNVTDSVTNKGYNYGYSETGTEQEETRSSAKAEETEEAEEAEETEKAAEAEKTEKNLSIYELVKFLEEDNKNAIKVQNFIKQEEEKNKIVIDNLKNFYRELTGFKNQVTQVDRYLQSKIQEFNTLKRENEELKKKGIEQQTALANLQSELAELIKEKEKSKKNLENLKSSNNSKLTEVQQLKTKVTALEEEIKTKNNEIAELEAIVVSYKKIYKTLIERLKIRKAEILMLKGFIENRTATYNNLKGESEQVKKNVKATKTILDSFLDYFKTTNNSATTVEEAPTSN
jgi:chromosome segregation ATPase